MFNLVLKDDIVEQCLLGSFKCDVQTAISYAIFYDALLRFTPFYLYTLTFAVLNCLLCPFNCGIQVIQKTDFHLMHFIMNKKVLLYL